MSFDIEKEAESICKRDGYKHGALLDDRGKCLRCIAMIEVLTRCRDETERECIEAQCGRCRRESYPERTEWGWWHTTNCARSLCGAFAIHERCRRREEQG